MTLARVTATWSHMNKLEPPAQVLNVFKQYDLQITLKIAFHNSKPITTSSTTSMLRYQKITLGIPRLSPFASRSGRPLLSKSTTTTRHLGRVLYSTQGYGDVKDDPARGDLAKQGVSQRTRELEHPGPEQSKKKSSKDSGQGRGSSDASKKGSERSSNIPPRSAKEEIENEMARGRRQS